MTEKLRGHNKFVGGGQFRVSKNNGVAAGGVQGNCGNCMNSLRVVSKLKIDFRDAKKKATQLESDVNFFFKL